MAGSGWRAGVLGNMVSSLVSRESRLFYFGATLSSTGQAAFLVAAGWLAFGLGGSGAVGLVTFATTGPLLFVPIAGGLLADRADRRMVVLVAQVVQGVVAFAIGLQSLLVGMPLWELTLLVFVSGVARAVEMPTVQSVLPSLVPPGDLLNAFSLNGLATRGSRFLGPAILAPVLATRGAGLAFLIVALLYVPAFAFVLRVSSLRKPKGEPITVIEQVREGTRFIFGHGIIALMLLVVVLHCWMTMGFDSTLPLFAQQNLRGEGAIFSSLVAATGLGSIVSGLVLAGLRGRRAQGRLLFIMGIASGVTTALMSLANVEWVALAAMFLVGASTAFFMTLVNTMVAEAAPDALRGRVSGIYLMSAGGIMSLGNLMNGYLAERFGASPVVGLPAVLYLVLFLAICALSPTVRRVFADGMLVLFPRRREEPVFAASADD